MNDWEIKLKNRFGDVIQKSVLLSHHTTIGVGGIADFFYIAKSVKDLADVVNFAYQEKIPFLVIGWGSNIVVSDYGFNGLIIKNESERVVVNRERGEIMADSGIALGKLLMLAASNDLGGIEFLAGIPGTLAGAIYNNAGSKNAGIGDYVKSITCLEERGSELKIVRHDHEWINFKYRNSKLKSEYRGRLKPVILTAKLRLAHKRKDEILRQIQDYIQYKKETQPLDSKSAGSFFKNPGIEAEQSAGYLLDHSGAKKLQFGGARVSLKHANFIVNTKNATAEDIRRLAESMRESVKNNYHITLEEEVEYIGKW